MLRTIRNARARVLVYIKLRDEKKKTKQKRKYCKIWVSKKQKINAFSGGCLHGTLPNTMWGLAAWQHMLEATPTGREEFSQS